METRPTRLGLVVILSVQLSGGLVIGAAGDRPKSETLMERVLSSGAPHTSILAVDSRGTPLICGTELASWWKKEHALSSSADQNALPPGTRTWETVPGVILNDGHDSFRLEVGVNSAVSNVLLEVWSPIISESGTGMVWLRDDGLNGDRVARDLVFTSEPLRFDTGQAWQHPAFYYDDTNSPPGISIQWVGNVFIQELTGETTGFAQSPQIGILSTNLQRAPRVLLSSNVVISDHLVNVQTPNRSTQQYLRFVASDLSGLATVIYRALPDAFDFLIFLSSDHLELLPYTSSPNFNAGVHHTVKVNYSGTGQSPTDETALWGSAGRLLGINVLDSYQPGLWGYNITHEILHQWASYTSTAISDGSHYVPRSNVASLLGGYLWKTNADQSYTLICEEGRDGATHAAPLDKYMMGLIPAAAVPMMRVYDPSAPPPFSLCNKTVPGVAATVSIGNIQQLYGTRAPGPASAKKDFSLGFVIESYNRWLNSVEITFYDILAAHFAKRLPAEYPDPYIGQLSWPPVERYFGEGTIWQTGVLDLVRPVVASVSHLGNSFEIIGSGYPGVSYSCQSTSNLLQWTVIARRTAGSNGTFSVSTGVSPGGSQFYRLSLP